MAYLVRAGNPNTYEQTVELRITQFSTRVPGEEGAKITAEALLKQMGASDYVVTQVKQEEESKGEYVIVHYTHGGKARIYGPFTSEEEAKADHMAKNHMRFTRDIEIVKLEA